MRNDCWYCQSQLVWDSDYDYGELYGDGEGIVTFLHCPTCGAEVRYAFRNEVD